MKSASKSWSVAEAKSHFSELIEQAMNSGPQTVTRNGNRAVVVVGVDEWERKTKRKGSLADFFAESPLRGSDLKIEREYDLKNPIDL